MSGRIIRGEGVEIDRWNAPPVERSAAEALKGARGSAAHLLTARQLDDLQHQVQQEAQQRGFDEGLEGGRRELAARVARLEKLIDALASPFAELDLSVEAELTELAVALASRLVRREIAYDAEHLVATVRECLAALPVGARNVTVHLNPADAELLAEHLDQTVERRWRIEPDAKLSTGDLRVVSDSSRVDGRLEARLHEIIAAALPA